MEGLINEGISCVSKRVGLDNKNNLKHQENSLKQLTLTVHGLIFGRAYYRKNICVWFLGALFSEGLLYLFIYFIFIFFFGWRGGGGMGLIIGILRNESPNLPIFTKKIFLKLRRLTKFGTINRFVEHIEKNRYFACHQRLNLVVETTIRLYIDVSKESKKKS